MTKRHLELHFFSKKMPELVHTNFSHEILDKAHLTMRGKGQANSNTIGSFKWTSAVKAISFFFIQAKLGMDSIHKPSTFPSAVLSGTSGIPTSLDYALSKEPLWLYDMFGADVRGRLLIKRIIKRDNPEMKRAGPVSLSLNEKLFNAENISIYYEDKSLECPKTLMRFSNLIQIQWIPRGRLKLSVHGHQFSPDLRTII